MAAQDRTEAPRSPAMPPAPPQSLPEGYAVRLRSFAIAVRTDWKGHGLGRLMMAHLIQRAWQRGVERLIGEVLPENAAMLQLCREFLPSPLIYADPRLRLASKTLSAST